MASQLNDPQASAAGTVTFGGDMTVSRLGFGAMQLAGHGVWGEPRDPAEARRLLRRCLDLGINFIDTADSYGPDVTDRLIVDALHPYPPGLVIATKAGYVRDGPHRWRPDGRPRHLRASVEASLKRLKLDRIDLFQFHTPDPKVPLEESLGALVECQAKGQIRHLGVSNVSLAELQRAQRVATIVSVQNLYNLADRYEEDVLNRCEQQGLVFIPYYPLGDSRLIRPGGRLAPLAERLQVSPAQLALAWLLRRSPAILPIPGTSSVTHLEENVAAASIALADADFHSLGA